MTIKTREEILKGGYAPGTGPIDPHQTAYAQNIKDLIASVKWGNEGVESVSYAQGILAITRSDGSPVLEVPVDSGAKDAMPLWEETRAIKGNLYQTSGSGREDLFTAILTLDMNPDNGIAPQNGRFKLGNEDPYRLGNHQIVSLPEQGVVSGTALTVLSNGAIVASTLSKLTLTTQVEDESFTSQGSYELRHNLLVGEYPPYLEDTDSQIIDRPLVFLLVG